METANGSEMCFGSETLISVVGLDSGYIQRWGGWRRGVIHDSSSVRRIGWLVRRVFNETWEKSL